MKRFIEILSICFCLGIITGCGWETPEKISIKTAASYNFSVGEIPFSAGTVADKLGTAFTSGGEKFKIYDYNPENKDDAKQQFIVEMPFMDYDLDFSSYLDQMDLSSGMEAMKLEYPFTVPSFSLPSVDKVIDLDPINTAINKVVMFRADPGTTSISFIMDAGNNYDSVEYSSGTLNIGVYNLTPEVLLGLATNGINGLSTASEVNGTIDLEGNIIPISAGKGNFNLANFVINNSLSFSQTGIPLGYVIIGTIDADSKVKEVRNLTLSVPVASGSLEPITFATGSSSEFLKSCEVDVGSITVAITPSPSWTGVDLRYSLEVTKGVEKADKSKIILTETAPTCNLHGTTYKNEDIVIAPSFNLAFTNADLLLDDSNAPKVNYDVQITKVANATIKLENDASVSLEKAQPLGTEVTALLKRINWNKAGVSVKYVNTLPGANVIKVNLESKFLQMPKKAYTVIYSDTEVSDDWIVTDTVSKVGDDTSAGEFNEIDFSASFTLPGYHEEKDSEGNVVEKTMTVYEVQLGDTYKIALEIKPLIDWKSIVIDNSQASFSDNFGFDFSLASLFEGLGEEPAKIIKNLGFTEMPLYLYCNFGNLNKLIKEPSLKGSIIAYPAKADVNESEGKTKYIATDTESKVYVLGTSAGEAVITSSEAPDLSKVAKNPEENSTGLPCITSVELGTPISTTAFADLFNVMTESTEGDSIGMDYSLKFCSGDAASEIEISSENLSNAGTSKISLTAVVVLPLELRVKKDIEIPNLLPMFKLDYSTKFDDEGNELPPFDLLQRTSKEDKANVREYAEYVKSASLVCDVSNSILMMEKGKDINLTVDLDGDVSDKIDPIKFSLQKIEIKLSPEAIFETYPLQPVVKVNIPQGTLQIGRQIGLAAKIKLNVTANGNKAFTLWDKNAVSSDEQE